MIRARRVAQGGLRFGILDDGGVEGGSSILAFGSRRILGGDALAGDERWHAERGLYS